MLQPCVLQSYDSLSQMRVIQSSPGVHTQYDAILPTYVYSRFPTRDDGLFLRLVFSLAKKKSP